MRRAPARAGPRSTRTLSTGTVLGLPRRAQARVRGTHSRRPASLVRAWTARTGVAAADAPPPDPRPRAGRRSGRPARAADRAARQARRPVRRRVSAHRLPAEQLPALGDRRRLGVGPVPPDVPVGPPCERATVGPGPDHRRPDDAAALPGHRPRRLGQRYGRPPVAPGGPDP